MTKVVSFGLMIFLLLSPGLPFFLNFTKLDVNSIQVNSATAEVFVRGPSVHLVTNNSASIFWRTDTLSDATVNFGLNESLIETVTNATLDTNHLMKLTGLEIDSKYYYQVESGADQSQVYHFLTAPADGEEFKLIIAGDNRPSQTATPTQPQSFIDFAEMIIEEEPHLIVLTGDYVYIVTGDPEHDIAEWAPFLDVLDRMAHYAPVIGAIGNHDVNPDVETRVLDYFHDAFFNIGTNDTYFSFDYAGVHLAILDTEEYGLEFRITGVQYDWLVEDLSSTSCKMKFVIAHQPLYPIRHVNEGLDTNRTERARLQALFEEQNVTLFGAGHDHLFDRLTVNDVIHVIAGGLGAPLYGTSWGGAFQHYVKTMVSKNYVNLYAILLDGSIAEEYSYPYYGPIEIEMRVLMNTSSYAPGAIPEVWFSSIPAEYYYSWDDEPNSTILENLPDSAGEHTLDIYAKNDTGFWSSEHFVFTTTSPQTITTDEIPTPLDVTLIIGIVGVVSVIVVVGMLWRIKLKSA